MHATDFLSKTDIEIDARVIAIFGSERYLKQECLQRIQGDAEGDEFGFIRIAGQDAVWRDVVTELSTVSMFGDQRRVMIDDADDFVSANRASLEAWVQNPARGSLLILDVRSWPANTRLAKAVAKSGLPLECSELKGATLHAWVRRLAKEQYDKSMDNECAQLIVQLAGNSLGLLSQEVAKLASVVGDNERISPEDVSRVVGGWRLETTWAMLDAVRDGNMSFAIESLEKLLRAGDAPQKVLGGTAFVFRKLAHATELARTGTPLPEALRSAGVMPRSVADSERYLRNIGYDRACQILPRLATADHDMKGGSRVEHRILLERLFVELSGTRTAG